LLAAIPGLAPVPAALDASPTGALIATTRYPRGGFDAVKLMCSGPISEQTVGVSDLVVSGPAGLLTVTDARAQVVNTDIEGPPWDPPSLEPVGEVPGAVYTVSPPGGTWDPSDDGTYTVSLIRGAVEDTGGNPLSAQPLQFQVAVGGGPTAFLEAPDVVGEGATDYTVAVQYSDDGAVDGGLLDASDISVTGPAGPLVVRAVSTNAIGTGHTTAAQYAVVPPGGSWDKSDDGSYTVTLAAGAVTDNESKPVSALTTHFNVNAAGTPAAGALGDLAAEIATKGQPDPRVALLPNQKGVLRVTVRNVGDAPIAGPASVRLVARPFTAVPGPGPDVELITTPPRPIRLRPGQGRVIPLRFTHPAAGGYQLVAQVDPANAIIERDETNNEANTGGPFRVGPPAAEPGPVAVGPPVGGTIRIGRTTVVPVKLWNTGNVAFAGDLDVDLFAQAGPGQSVKLNAQTLHRRVRLRPGQVRVLRLSVLVDQALPPGQYTLAASSTKPGGGSLPVTVSDSTPYAAA
jgi:hypothetical protein